MLLLEITNNARTIVRSIRSIKCPEIGQSLSCDYYAKTLKLKFIADYSSKLGGVYTYFRHSMFYDFRKRCKIVKSTP